MSDTITEAESGLLNFNWCSKKGYSRLKAAKFSVRKAEYEDIKVIEHKMVQEGKSYKSLPNEVQQKPWSVSCSDAKREYQSLWNEKLKFIREKHLEEKSKILDSKKNFQAKIVQRNRVLDKTSTNNDEDDDNLCYLLVNLKSYEEEYSEDRKRLIEKIKSIYPIYDISLACREKTLFSLSSLSNEDARNYCDQAGIASLIIQEKLASLDSRERLDGIPLETEGVSSLRFSLDPCCRRYKYIRLILQTVLTLKSLKNEERNMFVKHLEFVETTIDKYEACYVYILVRAYLNGRDVSCDDDEVKDFVEKYEQILIRNDALLIRQFIVAVTALHFNRELQYPILKFSIDMYKRQSVCSDDVVEKAICILNQQKVKVCISAEPYPVESIGLIPKEDRPKTEPIKFRCDERNYLCISDSSKFDFPIYIHKSEIIQLMKFIRNQFKFDFDGQYEKETALGLPHKPLTSLVVYWSKDVRNAKDIQGQLRSGEQTIQLDDTDYYVRLPGVKESYQDLQWAMFKRLIDKSEKYTRWFREIINQSGKGISSDHNFVLFAHAKVVSECARNLSTWMINLMCLDIIEAQSSEKWKNGH